MKFSDIEQVRNDAEHKRNHSYESW
jgi:hypothetical protein